IRSRAYKSKGYFAFYNEQFNKCSKLISYFHRKMYTRDVFILKTGECFMDPRKLLQATHMQQEYIPQKEIEPTEEKKVTVVQTKSINKEKKEDYKKESEEAIPTAIKKVKREDRDLSEYGINPDISTFQLYNYELSEFVTSFSRENKRNG